MKTSNGNGAVAQKAEKKILELSLSQIRRDGGTQSRAKLCSETAAEYAQAMRDGANFPNMIVFQDGKNYWLAAGFHRFEAHDQNGHKRVWCDVYVGTLRDAILYSVSDNYKHGLQRTNKDKRHACRMLLDDDEWWEKTDGWIADKCHVSPNLVAAVREEMEIEWELEEARRKAAEAAKAQTAASKPATGQGSTCSAQVETPKNGNQETVRQGRTRHGGTRALRITTQGKNAKGVKPVVVETEAKEIKKIERQEVRSLPKWIRQWKKLGRTLEEAHAELDRVWETIPVAEE